MTPIRAVILGTILTVLWYIGRVLEPFFSIGNIHLVLLQFLSLFIEAVPFLLVGSIVSGLVEAFIPSHLFLRYIPTSRTMQSMLGACMGLFFPVCECGVVPVVRRLIQKGMPVSMGIAFLLGAPVLNPVVLFGTYKAFGMSSIFIWRILGTFSIATIVSIFFSYRIKSEQRTSHDIQPSYSVHAACHHAGHDFLNVGAYLVIGALFASILQTFVPPSLLAPVSHTPSVSVFALSILAFVLSICSTVDAFVALGFTSTFTVGSIVSFLVFGPMVDIKSTMMFIGIFPRTIVFQLIILPFLLSVLLGISINFFPMFLL